MSSLGFCPAPNCQGPLCVSGREVVCERCQAPAVDHPLAAQIRATPAPRPVKVRHDPLDYAPGLQDVVRSLRGRVESLEKDRAELLRRVAALEQLLGSRPEAAAGGRKKVG